MRRIWLIALNDVRLTVRDRAAFIWMLLLPVAMMWMFGNMAGNGPDDDWRIAMGVSNRDDGWLSAALVDDLEDEHVDLDPQRRVRTLVVPEGFTEGVLAGEQQTLRLEREPGSNVGFGVGAQMHVVRAIVRALGRLIELDTEAIAGTDEAARTARLREMADRERLVELEVSTAGQGRPVPTGFNQSIPGTLTMIVLMMTLVYGGVFLTVEKQSGMLRRQLTLPVDRRRVFLGKLLGRLLIAGCQLVLLAVIGTVVFDFSWGPSPGGIAVMFAAYAFAVAGLATLLGSLASTPEQASSVGWIGSMLLAGLGGCWWPAEVMPGWLRSASHVFPTAWAMDGFHSLITFGRDAGSVALPVVMLLGFGLLFSGLGARFLRYE